MSCGGTTCPVIPKGTGDGDPPRVLGRRVRISDFNCTNRGEVVSLLIIARQDSSAIDVRG